MPLKQILKFEKGPKIKFIMIILYILLAFLSYTNYTLSSGPGIFNHISDLTASPTALSHLYIFSYKNGQSLVNIGRINTLFWNLSNLNKNIKVSKTKTCNK